MHVSQSLTLTLTIACSELNPDVGKVMSGGNVTQEKELFCEVSVKELTHCLGLRRGSARSLSITALSTLHTEQIPHKGCNL